MSRRASEAGWAATRRRSPPRCAAAATSAGRACACASTTARRGCSRRARPRRSGCSRWPGRCSTSREESRRCLTRRLLFEPTSPERLLERALRSGGDFADLYVERRSSFSLALDDRRVERAQSGHETGASVRVVAGDSTYFAHVDGLAESDLERLADEVAAAVRRETTSRASAARARRRRAAGDRDAARSRCRAERKAELLRECDERARARGRRGDAGGGRLQRGPARGSGGQLRRAARRRTTARACGSGRRWWRAVRTVSSRAWSRSPGHAGFELFDGDPAAVADEAARRALTMLDARPAPAGPDAGGGRQRIRRRAVPRGHRPRPRVRRRAEARVRVRGPHRRPARRRRS